MYSISYFSTLEFNLKIKKMLVSAVEIVRKNVVTKSKY